MPKFELDKKLKPRGDQPKAIKQLVAGYKRYPQQPLLGVTGSGKTFTIANVIQQVQKPTLVLSHNKTLAAQLYQEFQTFFPKNRVSAATKKSCLQKERNSFRFVLFVSHCNRTRIKRM